MLQIDSEPPAAFNVIFKEGFFFGITRTLFIMARENLSYDIYHDTIALYVVSFVGF